MTLVVALARLALLAYPSEFRAQFGRQILADIDDDPSHAFEQLRDLLKGAAQLHLDSLGRDIRYALRRLRSAPLFVIIVTFTFAIGIGANVALFSVLDAVILSPLPFPDPASLGIVFIHGSDGNTLSVTSITDSADLATRSKTIAQIAAAADDEATMLVGGKPYSLTGMDVTPNYFQVLGIAPQYGRILDTRDAAPGVNSIMISDSIWRRHFAADPHVVGRTVMFQDSPERIVGVLRPGQLLVDPNGGSVGKMDFLGVVSQRADARNRASRIAGSIVRLGRRVKFAQANAELALISTRLQKLYPSQDANITFSVHPLNATVFGPAASALWLIFCAVFGILIIACANVGNVLAARWSSRDREIAVRLALGASSRSIARQLLVEIALLAAIGTILGVCATYGALHVIVPLATETLPRAEAIGLDTYALFYAVATAIVATILAGLSPLLSLRSSDVQAALKSAGRGGDGSRRNPLRTGLVIVEIALALALVVISGLMLRNFLALVNTPLGVRSEGVVVTDDVGLSQHAGFVKEREILQRLVALPGVSSAALSLDSPLNSVDLEGPTPVVGRTYPSNNKPVAWANEITPGYFQTLGVALLRGRDVAESDTSKSLPVVVVNEAFARQYLSGTQVIGVRITVPPMDTPATVVGVVANDRRSLLDPAAPEFFEPAQQASVPEVGAVVYAPHVLPATIEREVQEVFARSLPLVQPPAAYTMIDRIANATAQARFATVLLGALGAIALLLALSGIFGVVSFSVTQRTREFGVRAALGATPGAILRDVLMRAIATALVGVAIGLGVAAVSAHLIAPQLTNLSPFDPLTFCVVVALIFVCTASASLQPALRATHVAPAEALRYE